VNFSHSDNSLGYIHVTDVLSVIYLANRTLITHLCKLSLNPQGYP